MKVQKILYMAGRKFLSYKDYSRNYYNAFKTISQSLDFTFMNNELCIKMKKFLETIFRC